RLDRGIGLHVPEQVAGASDLRADDAHGCAFGEGAEHAHDADADADVDAAGDHGLLRLAGALGIEQLEREAVLLEDAPAIPDLGDASVPQPALPDREPQRLLRPGLRCRPQAQRRREAARYNVVHCSSPARLFLLLRAAPSVVFAARLANAA